MKKLRFIPLLVAAPLLVSCGVAKPSKPRFADVGKEVKAEKFSTDLEKAFLASEFSKADLIGAGIYKEDIRSDMDIVGKVEENPSEIKMGSAKKFEMKFDKKNKIIQTSLDQQSVYKVSYNNYFESSEGSAKQAQSFQEAKVGGKAYFVEATKETAEYANLGPVTKALKMESYLDAMIRAKGAGAGKTITSYLAEYAGMSDKEKKAYKFYENGKVFTIEASTEETESEKQDGKVVYEVKTKAEIKIQVDLTKGNMKALSWLSGESVRTFKMKYTNDGTTYKAGDEIKTVISESEDISWVAKDVSLKAFDLSKFTKVGLDW